jgi:hypothetical protein
MELKAVGKLGMVRRKQFLQKRDISRSHEVKKNKQTKHEMLEIEFSIMDNLTNNSIRMN